MLLLLQKVNQQGLLLFTHCEAMQVLHKVGDTLTMLVFEGFNVSTSPLSFEVYWDVTVNTFGAGISGQNIL